MEAIKYEDGIILAERNFAEIKAKGKKYIERNAEKFLREKLWVSFYLTHEDMNQYIHIIYPPLPRQYEKVFFKKFLIQKNE